METKRKAELLVEYAAVSEEREALLRDKERLQALYQDSCFAVEVLGRVGAVLGNEQSVLAMESLMPVGSASAVEPFVRVEPMNADTTAKARLEVLRDLLSKNTTALNLAERRMAVLEKLLGLQQQNQPSSSLHS